MKRGKHFQKSQKGFLMRKGILVLAVSLLLAGMTIVTSTISWIEDVSQVKFSTDNDSQQTPVHIGSKILRSDAIMNANAVTEVNLGDYFNESGDIHLSPCYGDGDNFYFPIETGANGYRVGTKDDANVNYLSATFRLISEGATTAYWFEPSGNTPYVTLKDNGSAVANLEQYIRCSITIDGATTVYALNDSGSFNTITNGATLTQKSGKKMSEYTYYSEDFSNNLPTDNSGKANQGGGGNLNGNTLFNVNQYDSTNKNTIKTVTVKIWLEYSNATALNNADIASINLNLVSSFAKNRRIFVKDETVWQAGYDSAHWLPTHSSTLWFGLKDDLSTHWQLTSLGNNMYYVDVPAIYNNADVVFLRCSSNGWGSGVSDNNFTSNGTTVYYWNMWQTTFPNTFHSETYTVYSTDFATWEDASNVHAIYYVNSTHFTQNDTFQTVFDYMWDSNSVHGQGINDKVVKNANWPGLQMTARLHDNLCARDDGNNILDTYAFFYNSDYDRIIFNDGDYHTGVNQEYQTQDLWLTNNEINHTFDMSTLTWFSTTPGSGDWGSDIPHFCSNNTYILGNFSTNNQWKKTRLAYGGEFVNSSGNAFSGTNNNSSGRKLLCKVYIKHAGSFAMKLYFNGSEYAANNSGNYDVDLSGGNTVGYEVYNDNDHKHNLELNNVPQGVLRIYVENGSSTGRMKLWFAPGQAS